MKKIKFQILLLVSLVIAGTGCLKDKGFENHEYGINDPDDSPAGVGFYAAAKAKNSFGLDVGTNQTISDLVVFILGGAAPSQDVHISVVADPTIVTNYNTANQTNIQVLPATSIQFPATVTIPAGQRNVTIKVVIPTTVPLDATKEYGIGLKITSVDGGYTVASNLQNLFLAINIKNKYDGKYNLRGFHNRDPYTAPYNLTVQMITSGPASVSMFYPTPGPNDYAHPINGNSGQYYGTFGMNLTFNAANQIIAWDWTPYPTTLPTTVDPASNSRYDPATKTIYFRGWYNNNPAARAFTDTLKYLGPR